MSAKLTTGQTPRFRAKGRRGWLDIEARFEALKVACTPSSFTLGLIQMRSEPDPQANLDKAVHRIREAAASGAQIICLQELFRSPYFCQRQDPSLFDLAEPIPGPTTEVMSQLARETGS